MDSDQEKKGEREIKKMLQSVNLAKQRLELEEKQGGENGLR